ncbi:sensor histidine kinase [Nocardiopsis protaetiae]|uniref:sensor histidine kinase n=1 Tax=Nocardiopsis protaetiae TaxID=3382270 RepID=UPI00387B41CA
MSDWPLIGARRFEAYARWSSYLAVSIPIGTLLRSMVEAGRPAAAPSVILWGAAAVLCLALVSGNVLVTRWSMDTIVGRARRLPAAGVIAWVVVLGAFVAVAFVVPLPAMGVTVAAAIGSAAASFAPALDARRVLLLNAALLALAVPLLGVRDPALWAAGAVVITLALWICWLGAWTLWVLRELQTAHEDRARLVLADERLRIARDLHDVFGRSLAAISVKSALASELVDRGRGEHAARELGEIRRIAEEAGTEVRRVVRGELRTTWDDEVSGARSLLASAGIVSTVEGDPVPEPCAEAFGWVVREGVTNLLRHSEATRVSLTTAVGDGRARLTITNDGVSATGSDADADAGTDAGADAGDGTGLRAMSERIGALGGRVTARRDGDRFLLDATIPLPEEDPA